MPIYNEANKGLILCAMIQALMMYISATAALYSEMYSFGMTLVIWSF